MKRLMIKDLLRLDVLDIENVNVKLRSIYDDSDGEMLDEYGDDMPMIRTITKVELKKEKNDTWLYWRWIPKPEENGIRGYRDCGYSGVVVYEDDIESLYLKKED